MNKEEKDKLYKLIMKYGVINHNSLERKPHLNFCGNHFKHPQRIYRVWNGGTAIADGNGWYEKNNSKS